MAASSEETSELDFETGLSGNAFAEIRRAILSAIDRACSELIPLVLLV
jgi:hypothetical protein